MKNMQLRLLYLAFATYCASAGAQVLFQDGFNGTIDPAWTITRPDPGFFTIEATELDLRCSSLDIDVGPDNNGKNLFTIANPTPTNGDFVITLKLNSFVPANNNHAQVDIIAMDDEDNFVRANYGFIGDARRAEFGKEVAAVWHLQQTALDLGGGAFFLRLAKIGTTYTQSYSMDGTNYATVNSPITFGNGRPARLGFVCGVDPSESSHALIDSFTVEMPSQPPRITSQPRGQVGYWGKSVTFTVTATGFPSPSYQWLKDGSPIAGASESALPLTNLQATNAGNYSVIVSNSVDSTTSSNAYLTVNPAGVSLALYSGITIDGVVGLTYGIQYSTNLSNLYGWQGLANVALGAPTQLWFDVQPASRPQRYYRVVPGPIAIP